jgi:hypothetical protein
MFTRSNKRLCFAAATALALSACSDSGGDPPADDDDDDDDQVGEPDGGSGSEELAPPEFGFQIVTPEIVLAPGDERTFCYYTTAPIDADVGVKRWESQMTPGSHHLIVYFTDDSSIPDGTLTEQCGSAGAGPIWTYASQSPRQEALMPSGVGMRVAAGQKLFIQMHYLNAGTQELRAHVAVNGHTYGADESYIPAAAYVTYDSRIQIAPHSQGSAEGSCAVPSDVEFFTLSTHAHHFSTRTEVRDGDTMVFQSDDWEHPGKIDWAAPSFYRFQNDLHYRCEYENNTDDPVSEGDSARTDEMCMAVGYIFPSERPVFCYDGYVLPTGG